MTRLHLALAFALLTATACHPGPVVGSGGVPNVGGTIAGIVTTDGNAPVAGRKVTVINAATGARLEATTGVNGGYTIKVPQGTYRFEVELRSGERVAKQPGPTRIDKSDLDPHRDIVITAR
jgi:Carboxypeptidase regulatory-like domain